MRKDLACQTLEPRVASRSQRDRSRLIIVGVLAVLLIIFIVGNRASVKLSFIFIDFSMPVWLLTILLLAIGLVARSAHRGVRRKSRRAERRQA